MAALKTATDLNPRHVMPKVGPSSAAPPPGCCGPSCGDGEEVEATLSSFASGCGKGAKFPKDVCWGTLSSAHKDYNLQTCACHY